MAYPWSRRPLRASSSGACEELLEERGLSSCSWGSGRVREPPIQRRPAGRLPVLGGRHGGGGISMHFFAGVPPPHASLPPSLPRILKWTDDERKAVLTRKTIFIRDPAEFWAVLWDPKRSKAARVRAYQKVASTLCGGRGGARVISVWVAMVGVAPNKRRKGSLLRS